MKPIHKLGDTVRFKCPITGQFATGKVMRITTHRRHGDFVYHLKYKIKQYDGSTHLYDTTELTKVREHLVYKDIKGSTQAKEH